MQAFVIPQKRDRVFIVGFRSDLGVEWSFPAPTHSQEAMLWEQWVTGDYWERHQVPLSKRPEVPKKQCDRIYNLQSPVPLVPTPDKALAHGA